MEEEGEELIIKEVSYDPEIVAEDIPPEGTDDQHLLYRISSIDPKKSPVSCKIIRDGVGVYKPSDTGRVSGASDTKVIYRFTLINNNNISVQVMAYGATITSIKVPDRNGNFDDIVMGFDDLDGFRSSKNPYFGATIGRITGVIQQYVFSVEGEKYYVSNNYLSGHHANGGFIGFDKVLWNYFISADKLYLSYMSKDMEEGFPGDVLVQRCYQLTEDDELIIETTATCTKPTPVDITTHVDFNLSSHSAGPSELYKHYLMVNASKYAQVDKDRMLTGKLKKVGGTILDLRIPRPIGKIIHKVPGGGFDHYLSLTKGTRKGIVFAAKLIYPDNGRYLEVFTDQPGLQVYSQNNLYASRNIVEGHPISCWCHDPTEILLQQLPSEEYIKYIQEQKKENIQEDKTENVQEDKTENIQEEKIENIQEEKTENTQDEKTGSTHGEIRESETLNKKPLYKPLEGKLGAEYVRHGGIRLVPLNHPEPVARKHESIPYLLNPGQTYLNTTIYKFGIKKDKARNLAEITVPEVIRTSGASNPAEISRVSSQDRSSKVANEVRSSSVKEAEK